MLAKVNSLAFIGIDARQVNVQVHIANSGLPCFTIVGLPNKAVAESKERIRAAFSSIGLSLPNKRITVNLSPADLLKEGVHFDLAIAVALLVAMQIVPQEEIDQYIIMGELSLDGSIVEVSGVLPAAIKAQSWSMGLVCPEANGAEAAWSGNYSIVASSNLIELINHFSGKQLLISPEAKSYLETTTTYLDLKDVKLQKNAKRALEISAAGNHNLLMIGPPGSGKSMLAKRLPGLLPPLTNEEKLEASIIASINGNLKESCSLIQIRPFRDPHCSSSMAAMVGGGRNAKPGEVTLAHLGVLFLDELPEFSRFVLESLRQPIESHSISIARVNSHVTYPANFLLVAAMNPCKCGYYGADEGLTCSKVPRCAQEYQDRVSGPLFDRFDLQINVPSIRSAELDDKYYHNTEETSAVVAKRVKLARELQMSRFNLTKVRTNSELDGDILADVAKLDKSSNALLREAMDKLKLSMRGVNRVIRVARTIADLAEQTEITKFDIAEALNYRITRVLK